MAEEMGTRELHSRCRRQVFEAYRTNWLFDRAGMGRDQRQREGPRDGSTAAQPSLDGQSPGDEARLAPGGTPPCFPEDRGRDVGLEELDQESLEVAPEGRGRPLGEAMQEPRNELQAGVAVFPGIKVRLQPSELHVNVGRLLDGRHDRLVLPGIRPPRRNVLSASMPLKEGSDVLGSLPVPEDLGRDEDAGDGAKDRLRGGG